MWGSMWGLSDRPHTPSVSEGKGAFILWGLSDRPHTPSASEGKGALYRINSDQAVKA